MTVRRLLAEKPIKEVLTIPPDATIAEAVDTLAAHRIGALVVSPDGRTPVGILSERDVVRQLAKEGPAVCDRRVEELMTREVRTCALDDRAVSILPIMTQGRFRHMPVVEDGVLVGLLSIGDVVAARLTEMEADNTAMEAMLSGY